VDQNFFSSTVVSWQRVADTIALLFCIACVSFDSIFFGTKVVYPLLNKNGKEKEWSEMIQLTSVLEAESF
jgi:hypothetical protein